MYTRLQKPVVCLCAVFSLSSLSLHHRSRTRGTHPTHKSLSADFTHAYAPDCSSTLPCCLGGKWRRFPLGAGRREPFREFFMDFYFFGSRLVGTTHHILLTKLCIAFSCRLSPAQSPSSCAALALLLPTYTRSCFRLCCIWPAEGDRARAKREREERLFCLLKAAIYFPFSPNLQPQCSTPAFSCFVAIKLNEGTYSAKYREASGRGTPPYVYQRG